MDYKKITKRNKRGGGTLLGIVVGLIFVIGIFIGMFSFFSGQLEDNSATIDSKYNTTYNQLLEVQEEIEGDQQTILTSIDNIREADEGYLAAWNGFKALGATLLLPISFIGHTIDTANALIISTDIIPGWIQSLLIVGLIFFVMFVILSLLKGEPSLT